MDEPLTRHPASDRVTAEAVVVVQDRRLVPQSTWLADAAVSATGAGRRLQLVTRGYSRITYPVEVLLDHCDGDWVYRDAGGYRDGFTSTPVEWTGARFRPAPGGPATEGFPGGRILPGLRPENTTGMIEIQISTPHPATEDLELGASTETLMEELAGAPPAGWGIAEPVSQRWSARELTRFCRDRAPDPASLVVVGGTGARCVLGTLHVEPTTTGVLEMVRVAVPAAAAPGETVDRIAQRVAGTARMMLVSVHVDRDGWDRPTGPARPSLPLAVMIGHQVVAERGIDHARSAPGEVRILGAAGTSDDAAPAACWCRLDAGPEAPYELLTSILTHFDIMSI